MYFLGTFTPRLDDKGRLAMPARFRADLEAGMVITQGQQHCLFVYPVAEFGRIADELRAMEMTEQRRRFTRMFFGNASHEIPDAQGRVTIPAKLRDWARLERECAVVGAHNRIEIWESATWQGFVDEAESEYASTEEGVLPGI